MSADPADWSAVREQLKARILEILGPFPEEIPPLDPRTVSETPCEGYTRRKVLFQTQPGEDVPAYLMIPEGMDEPRPVAFCIHPTTLGAGKDRISGLSGSEPGSPPDPSRSYAHELAQRGYVVFAPDSLTDGERVYPGWKPYHTRPFYEANPEWSAVGKNIWDAMRGVDFLETVPEADCSRIATIGHSFGGHHSIFIAAFEERISCVAANGGVMSWRTGPGIHWARPLDSWYTYINKLRPWLVDESLPLPFEFWEFMALVAPRPILAMSSDEDGETYEDMRETYAGARKVWQDLGVPERAMFVHYPGPHAFPRPIRDTAYAWLHRWLGYPGSEV